jgi:hypothetical protein
MINPADVAPSTRYAVILLAIHDRLDAGRFDRLDREVNAPTIRHLRTIAQSRFSHSVILVLGAGPDDPHTYLSQRGRDRLALAVRLFRDGEAPFLLVSGGMLHPMLTRYCEDPLDP